MKKLISCLILLLPFLIFSCSESQDGNSDATSTSLVLTAKPTEIIANNTDKVVFTVKNSAGEDVTNSCIIYVNNAEIFDNTFSTATPGKYEAVAKSLKGEESNKIIVYAVSETAEFSISANKTAIVADGSDMAVLKLTDETGIDVTRDATFFLDGDSLPGNYVSLNEEGFHTVTARWNGIESSHSLSVAGVSFTSVEGRMLAEYSTYTGCQYCRNEIPVLEGAAHKSSRFVLVAIHRTASSIYKLFDENTRNKVQQFVDYFGGNVGNPSTFLNRDKSKVPTDMLGVDALLARIPNSSNLGISLRTSLVSDSTQVTVQAGITSSSSVQGNVGVILVENGLMAEQYGMGVIEMEQTMRDYQPSFTGEPLTVVPGTVSEFTTTVNIGRAKWNECNIIVFVTGADGRVINVQQVKAGDSIGY